MKIRKNRQNKIKHSINNIENYKTRQQISKILIHKNRLNGK